MRPADPLNAFDRAIGGVIGRFVPTTVLLSRSGHKQWFQASCRRVYDVKLSAYCAWGRPRSRVYGAARRSHNERTRNTLKHSTCSHTVSGGRHLRARSLVWNRLFLLSGTRRWFGGGS